MIVRARGHDHPWNDGEGVRDTFARQVETGIQFGTVGPGFVSALGQMIGEATRIGVCGWP